MEDKHTLSLNPITQKIESILVEMFGEQVHNPMAETCYALTVSQIAEVVRRVNEPDDVVRLKVAYASCRIHGDITNMPCECISGKTLVESQK